MSHSNSVLSVVLNVTSGSQLLPVVINDSHAVVVNDYQWLLMVTSGCKCFSVVPE